MTIGGKWSSLFHGTLQIKENVAPEVAEEALILIRWAYDKFETYCTDQGYSIAPELLAEKDKACAALAQRAMNLDLAVGNWPVQTFNRWEYQKPFHEALDPRELASDWAPFFRLAKKRYGYEICGEGR